MSDKDKPDGYYWRLTIKGGPGSGHWGHAGRPGQVGGSAPGGGLGRIGVDPDSTRAERQEAAGRYREGRSAAATVRATVAQLKAEYDKKVQAWRDERMRILDHGADLFEEHAEASWGENADPEKADRLAKEMEDNFEESNKLLKKIVRAQKALARKVRREILHVDNPAEIGLSISSDISKTQTRAIERGVNEFEKLVGTGTIDGHRVYCDRKRKGDRADCGWDLHLNLTPGDRERVVIHELGHWLEGTDRSILQKSIRFLNYRTRGETAKWLGDDYEKDEFSKFDRFEHPYSGKVYDQSGPFAATEIMSMGLQMMWSDPVGFAEADPEYFDFVYNTLRGQ